MTKPLFALFLAFGLATAAAAEPPANPVIIPNKNGAITFDHAIHQETKCETCHVDKADGGKIALNKTKGHKLCLDCHKAKKSEGAKTDCKSCHSGPKKK